MAAAPAHLVHGMGTALEAPVWPAITEREAAQVLAQFPEAGKLDRLRWHSPRPFSAAALIESEGGELLLKRHHRKVRTREGLAEEHRFLAHLRGGGIPVPEILRTRDGAGAVAQGEWSYELQRKAPGLDLYRDRLSWTPFLSQDHARAAGMALAQLHRAARGFDAPARQVQPLVASFRILPAANPMAAAQAYVTARPALADFLSSRSWERQVSLLFEQFGAGISELLSSQVALWTHNDWHPSNLLWSATGRVEAVFDFGLATRTCALHDLATAIERTAFDWLNLDRDGERMQADAGAALALLAGYHAVLPLDPHDRETLARLLPLVHIEFALSEIDYFHGVLADNANATLAWDGYLIGHAEWFRVPAAHAFLSEIRHGDIG